ncbi:hypothetical protein GCM10023093_07310 [Nemorincola caseinilytica]|uniref:HTH cro/C1-type domain-containing protein n=1 Tax=Nemorincola caseinilytica TaxID=2054315 RepID=A0ABP8N8M0_9BACT
MKTIPNTLREHRQKKYLAQIDIAARLGFRSSDRISRWEAGKTYPSLPNALRLANLLGAPIEELYPDVPADERPD